MGYPPYEIVPLTPEQALKEQAGLMSVYGEAFAAPPYSRTEIDVSTFSNTFARHAGREGFRCFVARENPAGSIAGFVYGYTSKPGQWWHDLVNREMNNGQAERWLENAFEIVELAVHPRLQGKGAGGKLHDCILDGLSYRTGLLSTMQVETVALKLYRKRGWVTLLNDFYFPGTPKPYQIMGLDLKERSVAC
jgi:ribosomal protein S18 acetylase RimI-like enzyme